MIAGSWHIATQAVGDNLDVIFTQRVATTTSTPVIAGQDKTSFSRYGFYMDSCDHAKQTMLSTLIEAIKV